VGILPALLRSGADSLSVPTLIAHGRYDYTVPYLWWEGVAEQLPNTTLRVFDRSGHQPFLEEPDRLASTIGLDGQSGRRLTQEGA
jgi:pimeloyl-ACP methyl ester carboxylesterase